MTIARACGGLVLLCASGGQQRPRWPWSKGVSGRVRLVFCPLGSPGGCSHLLLSPTQSPPHPHPHPPAPCTCSRPGEPRHRHTPMVSRCISVPVCGYSPRVSFSPSESMLYVCCWSWSFSFLLVPPFPPSSCWRYCRFTQLRRGGLSCVMPRLTGVRSTGLKLTNLLPSRFGLVVRR